MTRDEIEDLAATAIARVLGDLHPAITEGDAYGLAWEVLQALEPEGLAVTEEDQ